MQLTLDNLVIHLGGMSLCTYEQQPGEGVIHCCKSPCYQTAELEAVYPRRPDPYVIIDGSHVYVNMIDPPDKPLFYESTLIAAVVSMHELTEKGLGLRVHCNMGKSRSPSIVMLFLARRQAILNCCYDHAKPDMRELYPEYAPSGGIDMFMREHWGNLVSME